MKLQSLKSFEVLNKKSLTVIVGGTAGDSRRWDSTSQDSKKHDDYTSTSSLS